MIPPNHQSTPLRPPFNGDVESVEELSMAAAVPPMDLSNNSTLVREATPTRKSGSGKKGKKDTKKNKSPKSKP